MILLVVLFTLNMKSINACVLLVKPKDILVVELLVPCYLWVMHMVRMMLALNNTSLMVHDLWLLLTLNFGKRSQTDKWASARC